MEELAEVDQRHTLCEVRRCRRARGVGIAGRVIALRQRIVIVALECLWREPSVFEHLPDVIERRVVATAIVLALHIDGAAVPATLARIDCETPGIVDVSGIVVAIIEGAFDGDA